MSRTTHVPGGAISARPLRFLLLLLASTALVACEEPTPTSPFAAIVPRGPVPPDQVVDLAAVATTESTVTLRWTAVEDGRGKPAKYEMRWAPTPLGWGWGSATVATVGSCAAPITGSAVGATIECDVSGLESATSYDFQLVAYRETDDGRVYSALSNVATGATSSRVPAFAFPNEPSGHSVIAAHPFGALPAAGPPGDCTAPGASAGCWFRHDPAGNLSLVGASVTGDGSTLQLRLPAGMSQWASPGIVQAWSGAEESTGEEYSSVYESGFIRVPTKDFELGAGTYLLGFLGVGRAREGSALPIQVRFRLDPVGGDGTLAPAGRLTVVQSGPVHRELESDVTDGPVLEFGSWHQYEISLELNDLGRANGRVRVWIDGAPAMDHADVEWRTEEAPSGFYARRLDAAWTGGSTRTRQDVLQIDHLRLSGVALASVVTDPVEPTVPDAVSDLGIAAADTSSVTLRFTEVADGAGGAAAYQVRYAPTPIGWGWGSATVVTEGTCAEPLIGTSPGTARECTVTGLAPGTSFDFQMASFRESPEGRVYATTLSKVASALTDTREVTPPETVTDLSVASVTSSSVTLRFTEVGDGAGGAASYQVRYAPTPIGWGWGSATTVYEGECGTPISGTEPGSDRTCTVSGLDPDSSYDFQMSSFRDDEAGRKYAASLSNVVTAVTSAAPAGASVASVEVTPARVTLPLGGTVQLEAILRDAAGNLLDGWAVNWQSSNTVVAAVSAAGVVVAGLIPGTATVSATRGDVSGSATIEVVQAPDGGVGLNEPAGFTLVTERAFDARVEQGWVIRPDETFTIGSDATAPKSPSSVGQGAFLAGYRGEDAPLVTDFTFGDRGHRGIYVSFWVKLSENWQGHNSGVNKIGFAWIDDDPKVVFNARTVDDGPIAPQIRIQGTEMGPDGALNLDPNVRSDVRMQRGQWHHWEVVLRSNTDSNADGEIHWWLDGEKAGEYRNVAFTNAVEGKVWEVVSWYPIWGGGPDLVAETMYMWMDHIYVSGGS